MDHRLGPRPGIRGRRRHRRHRVEQIPQQAPRAIRDRIPFAFCHSPFETDPVTHTHGMINAPALFIVIALTLLLVRGIQESAVVNTMIVILKITIVIA